jgi:hypothetical protein
MLLFWSSKSSLRSISPGSILFALFISLSITACNSGGGANAVGDTGTTDTTTVSPGGSSNGSTGNTTTSGTTDITLSWVAPSEREDNTSIALSEIAGYKIYIGTTKGKYIGSVTINDGSATSYTFSNMSSGTFYFAITTRDTDGRESQYSKEVTVIT